MTTNDFTLAINQKKDYGADQSAVIMKKEVTEIIEEVIERILDTPGLERISKHAYRLIENDGSRLYNKTGGVLQELVPVASNKFVRKGVEDTSFEFRIDSQGSQILVIRGLQKIVFRKMDCR